MVEVISQVENGCQAVANSLLVLVPHKTLHGTISFSIQQTKLAANVGKTRAVKNKMPLIPAQSAAAEMPGDGWSCKPTLFDWQSMRPHAELHQQPQSGNGHWNLKLWRSLQLAGAQKPSKFKYVQSLALLEGAVLGETCRPAQTQGSSGMQCQKMKTVRPCQEGCTA